MRPLFVICFATFSLTSGAGGQAAGTSSAAAAFGAAVLVRDGSVLVGRGGGGFGTVYPSAGGVHIYQRSGTSWREVTRLVASNGGLGDQLGSAMAAGEAGVLVGAPGHREGRGTAYLFTERAGQWHEVARLEVPAAPGARVGASVALGRGVAVLGAPAERSRGTVYVMREAGGTWTVADRLVAVGDSSLDGFGAAVMLDGDRLIVGAPGTDGSRGAVYVYRRTAAGWASEAVLRRTDGAGGDRLGAALATGPDLVYAGAPGAASSRGAVVVFRRSAEGRWDDGVAIAGPDTARGARFATALAAAGEQLYVGAPGAPGGGAIYTVPAMGAPTVTRLAVQGAGPNAQFGSRVDASSGLVAVSAATADLMAGAVVVLERQDGGWRESLLREPMPAALASMTGRETRCTDGKVGPFSCQDVDLAAFIPLSAFGGGPGVIANDIWGWTDPETKREYALVGRSDGTAFVDLTDPSNPVYVGQLPLHEGATPNLWRDIKVYRDHAFIVADGAGPHGVQVFDLSELRRVTEKPATFRETAHYDRIASAHNIVINEETGFAYSVGNSGGGETCGGGLHMIDIRDPKSPTFAGCFSHPNTGRTGTGYSHDAQCVVYRGPDAGYRGREICFGANETALSIADVTEKSQPKAIASASYPNVAYTHQGWLSDDHRFFFLGDEADEVAGNGAQTRTLVWDVSDLDDPLLVKEYRADTRAIDHNQYVKGNYLYQSNLLAGLRILDVSDPANPREVGFFDTVPWDDDLTGFGGSWSNYPYFASGAIAVSSWNEGLFVLRRRERPVP